MGRARRQQGRHFTHLLKQLKEAFDWEDDKRPEIPANECIVYKIHPRGFQTCLDLKGKVGKGEPLGRSLTRSPI